MLFFNNNLYFVLDILHTALPSGNTCQIYNKSLQKNAIARCSYICQLHNRTFIINGQQKRTDRITYGEIGLKDLCLPNQFSRGSWQKCSGDIKKGAKYFVNAKNVKITYHMHNNFDGNQQKEELIELRMKQKQLFTCND